MKKRRQGDGLNVASKLAADLVDLYIYATALKPTFPKEVLNLQNSRYVELSMKKGPNEVPSAAVAQCNATSHLEMVHQVQELRSELEECKGRHKTEITNLSDRVTALSENLKKAIETINTLQLNLTV